MAPKYSHKHYAASLPLLKFKYLYSLPWEHHAKKKIINLIKIIIKRLIT